MVQYLSGKSASNCMVSKVCMILRPNNPQTGTLYLVSVWFERSKCLEWYCPPASEASREVANLTDRKFVCLSVINFDPNYLKQSFLTKSLVYFKFLCFRLKSHFWQEIITLTRPIRRGFTST